ncbi:hypothetical protein BpHYR1_033488 [Brachionus plicatilis]|uniref:Uncharacterized protein n=1 Tax=Brachionus plicatilis TaxID=10195 RepID=A0A3M7QWH9_BRAPC|nr:hypothetical protein BpHYR1_033488 [Brachionus plicatilis]
MRVTRRYLIVLDVVRANKYIWRKVFCGHFLTVFSKTHTFADFILGFLYQISTPKAYAKTPLMITPVNENTVTYPINSIHSCIGSTSYNTDKVNMARYVGSNKSKASSNKFYHYAKNNGNRPQYYQKTDTGLKKKTYGKRDDIVCYKCNKRGHYKSKGHKGNYKKINVANAISASESSADEDQCNMASEGKLLTSRGLIDGKPMKIAFDCGATFSIISNKMIDKHVMETIPTTEGIHDENIFEEEWSLDKASDKFECKPEQKLDVEEFEYFKMAVYSMKKIFAMDAKELGICNVACFALN